MNEEALYALAAVISVLFGGLVILVPIVALTMRFTLKPMLETWMRVRQGTSGQEGVLQDRRISLLEAELQGVQSALQTLLEADEFRRQLQATGANGRTPSGTPPARPGREGEPDAVSHAPSSHGVTESLQRSGTVADP